MKRQRPWSRSAVYPCAAHPRQDLPRPPASRSKVRWQIPPSSSRPPSPRRLRLLTSSWPARTSSSSRAQSPDRLPLSECRHPREISPNRHILRTLRPYPAPVAPRGRGNAAPVLRYRFVLSSTGSISVKTSEYHFCIGRSDRPDSPTALCIITLGGIQLNSLDIDRSCRAAAISDHSGRKPLECLIVFL